jgi:hypothetical protein
MNCNNEIRRANYLSILREFEGLRCDRGHAFRSASLAGQSHPVSKGKVGRRAKIVANIFPGFASKRREAPGMG